MSRAMNLTLTEIEVSASCQSAGVVISAIETLKSGGTRLVCVTPDGAAKMRRKLKTHIIEGAVDRYRFYRAPGIPGGY
jgi:putative hemolysin